MRTKSHVNGAAQGGSPGEEEAPDEAEPRLA